MILSPGHTFLSGTLELKSGVTLRLGEGATLKSSLDPAHYPHTVGFGRRFPKSVVAWDDLYDYNYPLIYAGPGVTDIKVLGPGTIETGEVSGAGDEKQLFVGPVGFFRVRDFELRGFKTRRTKGYNIALHSCSGGRVEQLDIADPYNGSDANCDGISMEGCQDLVVRGCRIESNDDLIYVWSSYRDPRGRTWWNSDHPQPTMNILVEDNQCRIQARKPGDGCHGFVIIAWGGACPEPERVSVRDVIVRNNVFAAPYPFGVLPSDPYFRDAGTPAMQRVSFTGNRLLPYSGTAINLRGARIEDFVEQDNVPVK